jgi:hypothetical protein
MVPVVRSARSLLPIEKALPNRQPETQAAQNANAMMTAGGAPSPTRQIQQGPSFCSSCGRAHRTGTMCSKGFSLEKALAIGITKGTITISGQKRGNPYRDEATGRFSTSGNGGGAGGGGGAPTQENTVMGARPKPSDAGGIGNAPTMQAPAPATSPAAASGGGGGAGGGTIAGKLNAKPATGPQNQEGITPSMIAQHEKQQAGDQNFLDALLNRNKDAVAAPPSSKPMFSHEGAQNAYAQERDRMSAGGASPDEAHAAGMKAGAAAYSNAIRPAGQAPAAPATPSAGPANTQQSGPPTGMQTSPGASAAPTGQQTQVTGPPTGMQTSPGAPAPAMPTAPGATSAPAPGATPGAQPVKPGAVPGGGGKKKEKAGLLDELSKPWEANARGMGAGLFTPGGTVGSTSSAVTGSAHGLLNYMKEDKSAAQQHQQKQQNAQKQSTFGQNQQQQHQGRMRQFAGQAGAAAQPGGSGMIP